MLQELCDVLDSCDQQPRGAYNNVRFTMIHREIAANGRGKYCSKKERERDMEFFFIFFISKLRESDSSQHKTINRILTG